MKIGELLIENGLINSEQLEKALDAQQLYGGKLGTNLVELGLVSEGLLAEFLGKQLHMEEARLSEFENIPADVLQLIPADFLQQHQMIPLHVGSKLRMAIADPHDLEAIDQLKFQIGKPIQAVIAPEIWIVAALERYFQVARPIRFIDMEDESGIEGLEITHDMTTDPRKMAVQEKKPESAEKISFEVYGKRLIAAESAVDVFTALMDYLAPMTPQMAVYVVRNGYVGGYMLRGFPVHSRQFVETRVALDAQSILCTVAKSGKLFQGNFQSSPEEEKAFGILSLSAGRKIELHVVPALGKVMAIFLGLLPEKNTFTKPNAGRLITLVCEKAGLALEIVHNKQKILKRPNG